MRRSRRLIAAETLYRVAAANRAALGLAARDADPPASGKASVLPGCAAPFSSKPIAD